MSIEHIAQLAAADEETLQSIWEILCEYDETFVPPLSARSGTLDRSLHGGNQTALPTAYFEQMKNQEILIYRENDEICGFMSFIGGYRDEHLMDAAQCGFYVSTIIVKEKCRGRELTEQSYRYIEDVIADGRPESMIVTRTWTGNDAHLHVLCKLGFLMSRRIENDRGEGIDTLYYSKKIK